jgi:3-methyladenine DNA glycosylase AlkD
VTPDSEAARTVDAAETTETTEALATLEAALRALGTPQRAAQEKRYLKSSLVHMGVTVPDVRKTVKATHAALRPTHQELVALAAALWASDVYERRLAAVELLKAGLAALGAGDLPRIEGMIREGAMWALVDPLAGDIAGRILLRDATCAATIDRWCADPDFWLRRSALLALLAGIRSGDPDLGRFIAYADAMLGETEFFVRKAIGWVARELSKSQPSFVASWAEQNLGRMSGVTFREVVRRLPEPDAERLTRLRAEGR